MPKKLPLRPNVCLLVFNKAGKLLLAERAGKGGRWQFPQGGAEPGLTLEENVVKEVGEELGIKPKQIGRIIKLKCTHEYDWDKPPAYARNIWRGQSQTFWLVEFKGQDSDIDLASCIEDGDEQELMSWRWCSTDEVRELAEPKRIDGYLKALAEFDEFLDSSL